MIIEISVAIISLAFVALVIYIIAMIKSIKFTLGVVNQTLIEARKHLDEMGGETKQLIENTNQVSTDLKQKMESLNSIFNAIGNIGEVVEQKTLLLKKEALASSREAEIKLLATSKEQEPQELNKFMDVLELLGLSIHVWQKFKRRR